MYPKVLEKLSGSEVHKIKRCNEIKTMISIKNETFYKKGVLKEINFNIDEILNDYLYMFSILKPFAYYNVSVEKKKQYKLNIVRTSIYGVWKDEGEELLARGGQGDFGFPIFTGFYFPYEYTNFYFLRTYDKLLLELIADEDRGILKNTRKKFFIWFEFYKWYDGCDDEEKEFNSLTLDPFACSNISALEPICKGAIKICKAIRFNYLEQSYETDEEDNQNEDNQNEIDFSNMQINGRKVIKHNECIACLTNKPNILFCSCGHIPICNDCDELNENSNKCPVCRTVSYIIRDI